MSEYESLRTAICTIEKERLPTTISCQEAFELSNDWLSSETSAHSEKPCAVLLGAAKSASVEVVSTAYLGLMRQAIFSLRTYYELCLAWLYYKDHPIEWKAIEARGEQIPLPGELKKYLKANFAAYDKRLSDLNNVKKRRWDDPYTIMCAFVHGGYITTLPSAVKPKDIVFDTVKISQLPDLIFAVSEFVSDVYVSACLANWHSLPSSVKGALEIRFSTGARKKLGFH